MRVLTPADHAFFEENGYLVIPDAVPIENCEAVIDALFAFLGMDRNNPDDWYREPLTPGGMVELYQHQALWDNRQHPRVHQIFSEIYGTPKLWVTFDRVNLKPPFHPDHPEYDHKGFTHWDVDTADISKLPFRVQGVLALTDTDETMGGFQCVPGFHKNLAEWIAQQPADRNTHVPDLTQLPAGMQLTPIPVKAGSLIIWNTLLAHGNGRNISDRPRLSQYIAMYHAQEQDEALRQERIACWRDRTHPPGKWYFPGDPRQTEQKQGKTAELTALGRKLLGLDCW
jgi:ectoine hydroxylase-related dioxygenase (phytanoyl-CoA dioxygenase family)